MLLEWLYQKTGDSLALDREYPKILTIDNKILTIDNKILTIDNKILTIDNKILTIDNKILTKNLATI